jgi:hypothetical protein
MDYIFRSMLVLSRCQMFAILAFISLLAPFTDSSYFLTSAFGLHQQNLCFTKRIDSTRFIIVRHDVYQRNNQFLLQSAVTDDDYVKSNDIESLQDIFSKYCDKDGLMSKDMVLKIPIIAEFLVCSILTIVFFPLLHKRLS